ncbi:MAG: DUF3159 domain-containing protein [Jatrophihabitans sp.]
MSSPVPDGEQVSATKDEPAPDPRAEHGTGSTSPAPDLRDQFRSQLVTGLGGWSGMIITAVPTVVFVAVNAVSSLRIAVVAAVGSALLLSAYRMARRQPVQQALSGLFGVFIAAIIAARTGQARGYFLLGIWSSIGYGGACLISMLARRPLIGVIWEFVDPSAQAEPLQPWYRQPILLRAYLRATCAATLIFAARGVVQLTLFSRHDTGWLAVTRIAMGYPLTALALGFAFWTIRRARHRLALAA